MLGRPGTKIRRTATFSNDPLQRELSRIAMEHEEDERRGRKPRHTGERDIELPAEPKKKKKSRGAQADALER